MEYQVSRNGNLLGSFDHPTLLALLNSGTLRIDDHYWHEGMVEWRQLVDMVGQTGEQDRKQVRAWLSQHRKVVLQVSMLVVAGIVGAAATMLVLPRPDRSPQPQPETQPAPPTLPALALASLVRLETPAADVNEKVPVVVREEAKPAPPRLPERQPALRPDELYRKVSPSVVMVRCLDKDGRPSSLGSGFFVEDGRWIATNRHVIEDSGKVEVLLQDGSILRPSSCRVSSEDQDVAILGVATQGQPIPWSSKDPTVGDRVYALGNPRGLERTLSDGLLSGERNKDGLQFYQMTAPISPGSSGGPVVGETGELVGMSTFMVRGGQNLNFAVRGTDIRKVFNSGTSVPVSMVKSSVLGPDAKPKAGIEVVKVEDGGSAVALTLRNKSEKTVGRILVRFLYHELPPASLREDNLKQGRLKLMGIVKDLEGRISDLELMEAAYTIGIKFLGKPPKSWTEADVDGLPTVREWTSLGDAEMARAVSDLHFYVVQFLRARDSSNPYVRQYAYGTDFETMGERALAYLDLVERRVDVARQLHSEKSDALLKAKGLLRQTDAAAAKAKIDGPKAWEEARQKISHYEDLVIDEEIAGGLVKRLVIKREKNEDWGVEVHVLDFSAEE